MKHMITGAFSYTGRYLTRRLLAAGENVSTLTNRRDASGEFGDRVKTFPLQFSPSALTEALRGTDVLYNTYWVRFPRAGAPYEKAVENSAILFDAARAAGVRRVVHVSIANPSEGSPLGYYRGKAAVEKILQTTGLSHAILRPTVIFGKEDILVNNIIWGLRTFPFFGIAGNGEYRMRPLFVEDMAALIEKCGRENKNTVIDAVGPETFTFNEWVRLLAKTVGRPARLLHLPPALFYAVMTPMGRLLGDVILTWEEIQGLTGDILFSDAPPAGPTKLSEWAAANAPSLGVKYANEMARRLR